MPIHKGVLAIFTCMIAAAGVLLSVHRRSTIVVSNFAPVTVILYNRIPKCGSSLLSILLTTLSRQKGAFTFVFVQPLAVSHRLTADEQGDLLARVQEPSARPIVYERHFHFLPIPSSPRRTFSYINQYRDPLERTLSSYDYRRFTCVVQRDRQQCELLNSTLRNMTMDECVATGDPARCITDAYGVRSAISYFCGHASMCDDSAAALALAKGNIERYYIHVGLLEALQSSLELLERIQPTIFTGLVNVYVNVFERRVMNQVPKGYRPRVTNRTREILRQLLEREYDLYHFIHRRFVEQYKQVFHRPPIFRRE